MSSFQQQFALSQPALRLRFGPGVRHEIAEELARIGARRALVLSTPEQADMAAALGQDCGAALAGIFSGAVMHTPVSVSEEATAIAQQLQADVLIAIGGGSTTGLGKAITLRTGLPLIAVPTTYAGSEATPVLGQTENGLKTTITDPKVQPGVILYDAELLTGLPVDLSVASGLNAMAHAAEGLYARDRSPVSTALAIEGLQAFATGLPKVRENPQDLAARGETLYGAWACGTVLGQVGMALHHKLCHTLGGSFGLPHAQTHAILLPHAIAYNAPAVPDLLAPICRIFSGEAPGQALYDFAAAIGAPLSLRDLGLSEADLDRAVQLALQNPYWNPRPLTAEGLRALLADAWAGTRPTA